MWWKSASGLSGYFSLAKRYLSSKIRPIPERYGEVFFSTHELLQESQWWSRERLEQYQFEQLQHLLRHAYEHSPFYRRRFDQIGMIPDDIRSLSDLRMFPMLTKDEIKKNLTDLNSDAFAKRQTEYVTTGGTSGIPLGFYIEHRTHAVRMAFEWRQFEWGGYHWGDRCVVIRGRIIENGVYEFDPVDNYLYLSAFDLTPENMHLYVSLIESFRPKAIRAYPSSVEIFAKFLSQEYPNFNQHRFLKAIFTSSETLYENQKALIEKSFRSPVFDKYGNSEQATIIGMCEKRTQYHDFMEYSLTEVVDESGNPVTENGGVGEIVSTPFTNYATPMIRYRTGDLVEIVEDACECGRAHRSLKRIVGRSTDSLIDNKGGFVSVAAINTHEDAFDRVWRFRYLQDKPGEAVIQIVKGEGFTSNDEVKIIHEAEYRSKGKIDFRVQYVDALPLTERGKFSFIENRIDNG